MAEVLLLHIEYEWKVTSNIRVANISLTCQLSFSSTLGPLYM